MIWENLKMAGRSLAGNKLRTFLTMLGVIIGVGAVVAINSIGQGLKNQVGSQVTDLGSNLIFVMPGQMGGGGRGFNPAASVGASTLTAADIDTIKHTQGVVDTTYLSLLSGIVSHGQTQDSGAMLVATTPAFLQVAQNNKIDKGRFFGDADKNAKVAVLGAGTRDTLFGKDADPVGQSIEVRGTSFKVIGVLAATSNGGSFGPSSSQDEGVYLPTGSAAVLAKAPLSIFRIAVKADNPQDVNPTVDRIKAAVKMNHGGQADFSVLTQKDLLSTINTILGALTGAIAAIAAISLLVGGIGIMNMMLVSVTERTREIGLRKALGATSAMVLGQFMVEAVVLTLLGGALGVGLAIAGGNVAGKLIKITPAFTASTILTALIISVAVGIIFGIAPAIKASRMRPIQALRRE